MTTLPTTPAMQAITLMHLILAATGERAAAPRRLPVTPLGGVGE